MSISENLEKVRATLPCGVELVAVSKTHPPEAVMEAYRAGQRIFGENRPQEMAAKRLALAELPVPTYPSLAPASASSDQSASTPASPADIRWHMIGHLQTNKVRLIAPFVELIHTADSAKLLCEIDRQADINNRVLEVLLEIKIAREESKEGWDWNDLVSWLESGEYRQFAGVGFRGVMGVATNTGDEAMVREEFSRLARMHDTLRERFFSAEQTFSRSQNRPSGSHLHRFDTLSMGMSSDYPIAIECSSTMVRLGSVIFGSRTYK